MGKCLVYIIFIKILFDYNTLCNVYNLHFSVFISALNNADEL